MKQLLLFIAILLLPIAVHATEVYDHTYTDGDILAADTTWSGRVLIDGVLFVPVGVTLTIMPGTLVEFTRSDAEFRESGTSEAVIPGSGIRVEGRIMAEGDGDGWISFTSSLSGPAPGDWGCIFMDHSTGNVFKNCRFEYSTYTLHAHFSRLDVERCVITKNNDGSRLGYSRAEFSYCEIEGNTGKGLNFSQCKSTVAYCRITGNYDGIFLNQKDAGCVIRDNDIHGNYGMDLRLGEFHEEDVSLYGNWWGTSDRDKIGEKIYDRQDEQEIGRVVLNPANSPVCDAGIAGAGPRTLWRFQTDGFVDSTPVYDNGRVYFGSWDGHLYCVDAETGELLWKFRTGDSVDSTPALHEGRVYFDSWDRNIYCLDAKDGALLWSYMMEPSEFDDHRQSSPEIWPDGGMLYVGGFNGKAYALRLDTGEPVWAAATGGAIRTRPHVTQTGGGPVGAVRFSTVNFGSTDGVMYSFGLMSGEPGWRFDAGSPVLSSPVTAKLPVTKSRDGRDAGTESAGIFGLFFGSEDGLLHCIDIESGDPVWSYRATGRFIYSSPLLADDKVIIGDCDGRLYALGISDGEPLWSFESENVIYSSPVSVDGMVVVGNNGGKVYYIDIKTGLKLSEFTANGPVQAVSAANGAVFAASRDGSVRAIVLDR